jgi:hypothetical protein
MSSSTVGEIVSLTPETRRAEWVVWAERLARPLLEALAAGRLHVAMPIEAADPANRAPYVRLEATARLLVGLAPWLELGTEEGGEGAARGHWAELARAGLAVAADPDAADAFNFDHGAQPLVDAAFLAQAFLRAPSALWQPLDATTQRRLLDGMRRTRRITPYENNWWLFAAMVEVFLHQQGEPMDESRLATALDKHEGWYLGDGAWGDGPEWHWDYYNAFVIQPMLVDIAAALPTGHAVQARLANVPARVARYTAVQERLVAPDGSFPPIGRSLPYRAGALQVLAQSALRHTLPDGVPPARARRALTLALRRTLDAPRTFDEAGWLRVGLSGHQPSLAEHYICTASLYLCTTALLPLGLPLEDRFWQDPDLPTTAEMAWGGIDLPADQALRAK